MLRAKGVDHPILGLDFYYNPKNNNSTEFQFDNCV
jgi:hypothetical protein